MVLTVPVQATELKVLESAMKLKAPVSMMTLVLKMRTKLPVLAIRLPV